MSQATDYTIDNSTGANVRSDINTVLGAIATNNSGGSDNGSIQALGFFANTSTSKLQLKNAAGNAFINLRGFDGTLPLPDGSASSPSLFFDDDTNTGVFSSAADNFDIATGGTVRFNINGSITKISDILDTTVVRRQVQNSSVHIAGGNNTNDGANAAFYGSTHSSQANVVQFRASATNTIKIDGSGRLLINTTSSREIGGIASRLQLSGTNTNTSSFSITNNNNDANGAMILLAKQRSGSAGGTTIVNDGDVVGVIRFIACDGSDMVHRIAQIHAEIDGTPGANDLPGRLVFYTSPDSGTTPAERMSINNAGGVLIGVEADSVGSSARAKLSIDCNDIDAVANLGDADKYGLVFLNSPTTNHGNGIGFFNDSGSTCGGAILHQDKGSGNIGALVFYTSASSDTPLERLRIKANGNTGIGVSDPQAKLQVNDTNPVVAEFYRSDGGTNDEARIALGAKSGNIPSQRGVLLTAVNTGAGHHFDIRTSNTASAGPTTKMRIKADGNTVIDSSDDFSPLGQFTSTHDGTRFGMAIHNTNGGGGNQIAIRFHRNDTDIGSISTTGTATHFNTSSDYRLKENAVAISDGITRLKTLKPYRFNWKSDPTTTVDGFFAHEVTAVPEAISGTKDEVALADEEQKGIKKGDAIYQSIDQSKLVPLLVAAVQELITKVETLEAA
jgi:hypothetical protein